MPPIHWNRRTHWQKPQTRNFITPLPTWLSGCLADMAVGVPSCFRRNSKSQTFRHGCRCAFKLPRKLHQVGLQRPSQWRRRTQFARPWPRACQISDYVLLTITSSIFSRASFQKICNANEMKQHVREKKRARATIPGNCTRTVVSC